MPFIGSSSAGVVSFDSLGFGGFVFAKDLKMSEVSRLRGGGFAFMSLDADF
jgi:hypothetical protein